MLERVERLTETLKRAAAALERERVPYLLGGGLGCWARGGPPSSKDVDLMVKRDDAERALAALGAAGMRTERPPEQWLFKAWDGEGEDEVMIDLIFEPVGIRIGDQVLGRGEDLNVDGMWVRTMDLDDIMVTKLLAIDERCADYAGLLEVGRALREQIEWEGLRARTASSPFAEAFFVIADGLGISRADDGAELSRIGSEAARR